MCRNMCSSLSRQKSLSGKLNDMVSYLLPYYIEEGKSQLVIGIGCTGGKHRSVTIAIQLYEHLKAAGYNAVLSHRDIQKDQY